MFVFDDIHPKIGQDESIFTSGTKTPTHPVGKMKQFLHEHIV